MKSDVMVVKLSTGEELVARYTNEEDSFVLDKPHMLMQVPGPNNQIGFGFAPWMMAGDIDKVSISKNWIVTSVPAKSEISDMYLQQVTGLSLGGNSNLKL